MEASQESVVNEDVSNVDAPAVGEDTCPRCHTKCANKYSVIRHLQAKTVCPPLHSDEPPNKIIERLHTRQYTEDSVQCEGCGKRFKNRQTYLRHRRQLCNAASSSTSETSGALSQLSVINLIAANKMMTEALAKLVDARMQAMLPPDQPTPKKARVRQTENRMLSEQDAVIEVVSLESDADQREMSLPDATRAPICVYCIFIGYCAATDRRVYTFGLTRDLQERVGEHRKAFSHAKVVFVVSLGQFDPASVEDAVRDMELVRSRALKVSLPNGVTRRDCFACAKSEVDWVLRELLSELKRSHSHKVQDMWAYDPALLPAGSSAQDLVGAVSPSLVERVGVAVPPSSLVSAPGTLSDSMSLIEVEREKTRQAELAVEAERLKAHEKTAQLRLQLQLEMVRQGHVNHALNFV